MAAVQVPTELFWAVAGVIAIGAVSTIIKIKAARWLKEKRKKERALAKVDIEDMAAEERSRRRRSRNRNISTKTPK